MTKPLSPHQLKDRLLKAETSLVVVGRQASIDQLTAALGLIDLVQALGSGKNNDKENQISRHGTFVYSGQIPGQLDFLKPQAVIQKNADSLQDLAIVIDRMKADKLRYRVEDDIVKILITPFRDGLSEKDLKFQKGDYNVDLIITLGIAKLSEVDPAITTEGNVFLDRQVINLMAGDKTTEINGSIWQGKLSTSLSEMITELAMICNVKLGPPAANALLSGIFIETERFKNKATTTRAMQCASQLLQWGAQPSLVAQNLENYKRPAPVISKPAVKAAPAPEKKVSKEDKMAETKRLVKAKMRQAPTKSKVKKRSLRTFDVGSGDVIYNEDGTVKKEEFAPDKIDIDADGILTIKDDLPQQIENESPDKISIDIPAKNTAPDLPKSLPPPEKPPKVVEPLIGSAPVNAPNPLASAPSPPPPAAALPSLKPPTPNLSINNQSMASNPLASSLPAAPPLPIANPSQPMPAAITPNLGAPMPGTPQMSAPMPPAPSVAPAPIPVGGPMPPAPSIAPPPLNLDQVSGLPPPLPQ